MKPTAEHWEIMWMKREKSIPMKSLIRWFSVSQIDLIMQGNFDENWNYVVI